MAAENTAQTLLSYKIDTASVNAAVSANTRVSDSYKQLVSAGQILNRDLGVGNFQQLATAGQILQRDLEVRAARESFITDQKQQQLLLTERLSIAERVRSNRGTGGIVDDLRADAFGGGGAAGGGNGGLGRGISRVSRGLFNLPDVQLGGGVSTTFLSRVGLLTGGAVEALGLTATSLAGIGLVAGGVILALKAVTDAEAARGEAAKKTADQIRQIAERGASGATTPELQGDNAQLTSTLSGLEEGRQKIIGYQAVVGAINTAYSEGRITADGYRSLLTDVNTEVYDATGGLLGMKDGVGVAVTATGNFSAILDANGEDIKEVTAEIAANNVALGTSAVAYNDARAAAEEHARVMAEANEKIRASRDTFFDSFIRAEGMTTDARQREIANIENQIRGYEKLLYSGTLTGAEFDALRDRIGLLQNQIAGLTDATSLFADSLEALEINQKNLTDFQQQQLDLIDQEIEARDKLFEINQRIADIEAQRAADIAAVLAESGERLKEIAEDNAEARIRIEEDTAERIAQINRDADRALTTAIGERDVAAFTLAKIRQKDALEDESKAYEKRLKELDKALIKAELSERKSQEKRLQQINDSANRQLTAQYRAAQEQEFIIATSLTSQRFLTEQGMAGMVVATANGFITMQEIVVTSLTNMVGAIRGIFGSGGSQFPPLVGGGRGGGAGGGGGALIDRNTANMYQAFRNLKQRTA